MRIKSRQNGASRINGSGREINEGDPGAESYLDRSLSRAPVNSSSMVGDGNGDGGGESGDEWTVQNPRGEKEGGEKGGGKVPR